MCVRERERERNMQRSNKIMYGLMDGKRSGIECKMCEGGFYSSGEDYKHLS